MKSPFHFSPAPFALRAVSGIALATLVLTLSACGQKGPLYLGKPPARIVRTAPAPVAPLNLNQRDADEEVGKAGKADKADNSGEASVSVMPVDLNNDLTPVTRSDSVGTGKTVSPKK